MSTTRVLALDASGNVIEVSLSDLSTFDENRILSGPEGQSGVDPLRFWDIGVLFDQRGNVLLGA